MGDRPGPQPCFRQCTDMHYPEGKQPCMLQFELGPFDMVLQPGAYPEPPIAAGWTLQFIRCMQYLQVRAPWQVWVNLDVPPLGSILLFNSYLGTWTHRSDIVYPLERQVGTLVSRFSYYTSPDFICDFPFFPKANKPSWDAAGLLVIPEEAGYFAEEFDSTVADRRLRYSNERNGTNLKVWLNS